MRILVLGGTRFVGRALVAAATDQGHAVTLFNRGRSARPPPDCEWIAGDRTQDLCALDGRHWDAVLDTWDGDASAVSAAVAKFADRVERYAYVSTTSVYLNPWSAGLDEECAIIDPALAPVPANANERYRIDKAGGEAAVGRLPAARRLILRSGVIVGPHDTTGRLASWLRRFAEGGRVTAPMAPNQPLQLIDVRDLAAWAVRLIGRGQTGTFNAVGPAHLFTFGAFLAQCRAAAHSASEIDWTPEQALVDRGLDNWTAFPFWIPHRNWAQRGFFSIDNRKAVAGGLTFRPLAETISTYSTG